MIVILALPFLLESGAFAMDGWFGALVIHRVRLEPVPVNAIWATRPPGS